MSLTFFLINRIELKYNVGLAMVQLHLFPWEIDLRENHNLLTKGDYYVKRI